MSQNRRNFLSLVMKAAWEMLKSKEVKNLSDAMRFAWKGLKLKMQLLKGVVEFKYMKISTGMERLAHGTLSSEYLRGIPSKNSDKRITYKNITYFDIDKNGLRSFRMSTLI